MKLHLTSRRLIVSLFSVTAILYAATILVAMHYLKAPQRAQASTLIADGRNIFNFTPIYAPKNTGARVSCGSCHASGGFQPTAASMIDVAPRFPQFSARAKRTITLNDRIRECFVRSENGTPPADNDHVMLALLAYIQAVSGTPHDRRADIPKGLPRLASAEPNPAAGQQIYAAQCAGCHGEHGEGKGMQYPPLWGAQSFNDGAGMDQLPKLAAFVKYNMPQNRKGILTTQQAYDVAAYIQSQPRPAMNPAYAWY